MTPVRCVECREWITQELAPAVLIFRGPVCDRCDEENKRRRWLREPIDEAAQ